MVSIRDFAAVLNTLLKWRYATTLLSCMPLILQLSNLCSQVSENYKLVKELKRMTMTNISLLPLHCTLKLPYPFAIVRDDRAVTQADVYLEASQSNELLVQFDPNFEDNKSIRRAECKLKITYRDHPSTDEVSISGDVFYPNLQFDTTSVRILYFVFKIY